MFRVWAASPQPVRLCCSCSGNCSAPICASCFINVISPFFFSITADGFLILLFFYIICSLSSDTTYAPKILFLFIMLISWTRVDGARSSMFWVAIHFH